MNTHELLPPHKPANVLELVRPFDPISQNAEGEYDAVVRRLNRVRARKTRLSREKERLERQFVEGDFTVQTGVRRGESLSIAGRKQRLTRLIEVGAELLHTEDEERFATGALHRMNQALDRWARDTYGG